MRNKQQYSAVALCALGIVAAGLTGCGNKEPEAKTKQDVAAFNGDMSKMPAAYRAKMTGGDNAALAQQQAAEAQKTAGNQNATTTTQ